MSKTAPHPDVLVLGRHPCAYLAAASLRLPSAKLRVAHATIPGERAPDRLVLLNPDFFDLHKSLAPLHKKLDLAPVHGLRFLAADPKTSSESRHKSPLAYVANYEDLRQAMIDLAKDAGVELHEPKSLEILSLDEQGVEVQLGKTPLRAKALIVAGELPKVDQKRLGMPDSWGEGVVHTYSFCRLKGAKWSALPTGTVQPMSLDLDGNLCWAWLLHKNDEIQLAVEQPQDSPSMSPQALLSHWASILHQHGILPELPNITPNCFDSLQLPLAGALAHEGVANRTLLIGPAGGFLSATGEDLYPTCWSAIHAADVIRKAIKEKHLQDAINTYRQVWRTTLGDYLRGPQQNLKFLLPLVYRNQVMTDRLTESILQGKSVVR